MGDRRAAAEGRVRRLGRLGRPGGRTSLTSTANASTIPSTWRGGRSTSSSRAKPDQPFCLIVLYKSPHDVQQPDPRDADLFKDDTIVPPKTATDEHFNRLPEFMRVSMGRSRAVRDFPTPEKYQEYVKNYLRCIASVDRSVGEILKALADKQVADDTLTVFSSDNGYFLGERGLIHKWLMYEESIRVPLIVHYPRLAKIGTEDRARWR